jgi:ketosteroid isomerase-like protein
MTKFTAAILVGLLSATACAPAADPVAIGKALTQLDDDWSKAAGARNVDAVAAFYATDAIAYPPDAPVAVGFDAAKKVWAAYFADSTFRISWKTTHAGGSKGGDLGYTTGTYEDSFIGPDGKKVTEIGKYVCIWAKQADGSWKAIHDTWNTDSK